MKEVRPSILMIMYGKSVGGAELQFIELANYLANSFDIRLISLGGDAAVRATKLDERIELQVFSYNNPFTTLIALFRAFFSSVLFPSRYIVTTSFIGFVGYAATLFRKRKLISLQTVSKCMRYPTIDRYVLRRFDLLIAGANDIKEYLIAHGQNQSRIRVIHNWVDFSKRIPSANVIDTKTKYGFAGKTIIGCIGRLHPQKGQVYLIRAFARAIKEFPDLVLILTGDGPSRLALEEEVRNSGLTESVVFSGTITGEEYNNILSVIDIYVQPSVFEGLPRTLLDAMYMGKAIVATDINGNREAIQNESNGLLVPPENQEALYLGIKRLLEKPDDKDRFSVAAKSSSGCQFDMNKQLGKIEAAILEDGGNLR